MQEFTLKELQLIQSAFRNWRLLMGGMGDWSEVDKLEKKLERKARLLTKRAPDVVESAASVSISLASEVSASEADSSPATTDSLKASALGDNLELIRAAALLERSG